VAEDGSYSNVLSAALLAAVPRVLHKSLVMMAETRAAKNLSMDKWHCSKQAVRVREVPGMEQSSDITFGPGRYDCRT
jgi:hypothetical protein